MTAFTPGVDTAMTPPNPLAIEFPPLQEQLKSLKLPRPYFSSGFRAWCKYGRWTTGVAEDGKTWIVVGPDGPRKGGP